MHHPDIHRLPQNRRVVHRSPVGEPAAEADIVVPEYTELQSPPTTGTPMPRYFNLNTINTETLATYGVHIERVNPLQEGVDNEQAVADELWLAFGVTIDRYIPTQENRDHEQAVADKLRRNYEEEQERNYVPSRAYEMY